MNFSIKKLFCTIACGALVLTAVPAQAVFNFSDWFAPKAAAPAEAEFNLQDWPVLTVAGLTLGAIGLYKLYKQFFGYITIEDIQDFKDKQNQLVPGAVIKLKTDFPWSICLPHVAADAGVFKAGKYTVKKISKPLWSNAQKAITFSPEGDSRNGRSFTAYIYTNKAVIGLTEKHMSSFLG